MDSAIRIKNVPSSGSPPEIEQFKESANVGDQGLGYNRYHHQLENQCIFPISQYNAETEGGTVSYAAEQLLRL